MSKEIKPCPFCGSSNVGGTAITKSYGNINCLDCGVVTKNQNIKPQLEVWNARKSSWIDVNDRLPDDGLTVIVADNTGHFDTASLLSDGRWDCHGMDVIPDCVHFWMPIPDLIEAI